MKFSILFWNIWFYNQIDGKARSDRFLAELKKLLDQHKPDLVALSEVTPVLQNKSASVVEYLQRLGYSYNHCAHTIQFSDVQMSGVAICSRFPIGQKRHIVISKNGYAAKHGHPDIDEEIISTRVTLPEGHDLKVIVANPSTIIDSRKEHQAGMESLSRLVHSRTYAKNTILVGDMNEWRLIPDSFRRKVADVMYSRTGTMLHPTWRYDAHRFTPLRANLDYVYWSRQSDFSMKSFEVLPSNVSDHRPLLAGFEYRADT